MTEHIDQYLANFQTIQKNIEALSEDINTFESTTPHDNKTKLLHECLIKLFDIVQNQQHQMVIMNNIFSADKD